MIANPPKADEFEVSVFGPGYGECVLVHLGGGQWMIVDSCRDQRLKRQPALDYLRRMGVRPESDVRVVVATHWHRDHVRGLGEVVKECVNSDFWTSAAMTSREALMLTGQSGDVDISPQSPLREYKQVIEHLMVRSEGIGAPSIRTAVAGSAIYRRTRAGKPEAEVRALSPHKDAVAKTTAVFEEAIGRASPGLLTGPDIHPNHAAIALEVVFGSCSAVLGSDLEAAAPGGGWASIVSSSTSAQRAAIFKVPHHGSATSHVPAVWSELLQHDCVAAVTPFRPEALPRPEMVERILDSAGRAFVTASPSRPRQRENPRNIRALQLGSAVRVEELEGRSGHIRMRMDSRATAGTSVEVDLRRPAIPMEALLN